MWSLIESFYTHLASTNSVQCYNGRKKGAAFDCAVTSTSQAIYAAILITGGTTLLTLVLKDQFLAVVLLRHTPPGIASLTDVTTSLIGHKH
ncbi:hypothetical protein A2U01_0008716 [Trifolium medium]|uniref:Uncharacterized protein n=1 Tax=Trifolium medium TaxID=97028 RepID=A0A392ML64_9FABA|nr:hypothetical protein [Trifolium medium]